MVQLNPVPVFGSKKSTSTIGRKFFTEIAVQMVSAHRFPCTGTGKLAVHVAVNKGETGSRG